jgi:hypothetical protein
MYHRITRGGDLSAIKLYGKNLAIDSPVLARLATLIGEGEVDVTVTTSPRPECLICKLDCSSSYSRYQKCLHSESWPCPVQTIGRVNTSQEGSVTSILAIPFVLFGECPICLDCVLAACIVISVNCGHPMCIFCIVRASAAAATTVTTDDPFGVFDTSKRCSMCRTEIGLYLFLGHKLLFHGADRLASSHQTREYIRNQRIIGVLDDDEQALPGPEKLIIDTRFGFVAPLASTNCQLVVVSLANLVETDRVHFEENYQPHPEPSEVSSKVYCRVRCQLHFVGLTPHRRRESR